MSEVDTNDLPEHGWIDSEFELPGVSSWILQLNWE